MKGLEKLASALAALSMAAASAAHAEPSTAQLQQEIEGLRGVVDRLQRQLDEQAAARGAAATPVTPGDLQGIQADLENFKYEVQRQRERETALSSRALMISGTIQARAGTSSVATTTTSVYQRKGSFDIGTAIVGFTGNLYRDYEAGRNLGYRVSFGASQQASSNNSFLNLQDAYIAYSLLPTISQDTARMDVFLGQQQLPFGLEVQSGEELRPVINGAQFTNQLGLSRRQVGLIVRGDLQPRVDYGYNYRTALLSYAFGAVNGSGPNTSDDNNHADLVGRVAFAVPTGYNSWLRQLTFGASAYLGKGNWTAKGFSSSGAARTFRGVGDRNRYGADVTYNHDPFGITYEYIRGQDETAVDARLGFQRPQRALRDSRSSTLTLFYSIGEQFLRGYRAQGRFDDWWPKSYQFFVRLDRFDPDLDASGDRIDIATLGMNVFFAQTTKFQLNLNRYSDARNGRRSEVIGQFQFGF